MLQLLNTRHDSFYYQIKLIIISMSSLWRVMRQKCTIHTSIINYNLATKSLKDTFSHTIVVSINTLLILHNVLNSSDLFMIFYAPRAIITNVSDFHVSKIPYRKTCQLQHFNDARVRTIVYKFHCGLTCNAVERYRSWEWNKNSPAN